MENDSKLIENLERLNHNLEKQVSLKFIILKGVVYGLGTVIGATIVAGIVFSFFASAIGPAEEIPIIRQIPNS